jgi:hypothetical protein
MTNAYYNYTDGQPVAISRGASSLMRAEFTLISAGFDTVSNAINGKGAITGQNWTGTHDYTAGTIKVPTLPVGSSGTFAASVDYVNQQAYSAALPGQTGNADKLVTTDGAGTPTASFTDKLNVTVLKFVDGTDKTKQVQFDASGLTTNTTRHLTVQDKDGTLALTSDISAASGSSVVLLAQATVSTAVANIDFLNVFTSAYGSYRIEIEGLTCSFSSGDQIVIRLANGGAVDTAAHYIPNLAESGAATAVLTSTLTGLSGYSDTLMATGTFEIGGTVSSTAVKWMSARLLVYRNNTGAPGYTAKLGVGGYSGGTVSGFRLFWSGAYNFTAGTVRVYGIKNS